VEVTNEFTCANRDTMYLTVTQFPVKPSITSGPASVDNYVATTSTYNCSNDPNATTYEWAVTPAEAGTTTSTGTAGTFTWATDYTGAVQVTVKGINDCGTSDFSDAFATTIYSSQGVNENAGSKQLVIYPNPTEGKITLSLSGNRSVTGELTVTDATGATVYGLKGMTIQGGSNTTLDLGQLSKGIYSVKLSSKTDIYYGKVIIK
jgi:hypothetical protein